MDPTENFGIIEAQIKMGYATEHDFTPLIKFRYLARMR